MNCRKLYIFLIPLLILLGCSKKAEISKAQVLRLNFTVEPPTLDPRKGADLISSTMQFMLFEGLTKMTPESTTAPGLAKHIDISKNKRIYTFHLRDALWSNGDPITAEDVALSWKDMLTPSFPAPNAHLLYPIKNAEKVKKGLLPVDQLGLHCKDSKTLVVTLERPTPYFLELTSFCALFPVNHRVTRQNPGWADDSGPDLVTSGPFLIKSWKHQNKITLIPNPNYFDRPKVKLDKIRISFVSDDTTALQMFEQGELDIIGAAFSSIPIDSIPYLKKEGLLKQSPVGATTMLTFNTKVSPLTDTHLRRALAYCINRQTLVDNVTQSGETVATGPIPPILKGGRDHQFYQDLDVERALKELSLAGDSGEKMTLSYANGGVFSKIAQILQDAWKEQLGIEVDLEGHDMRVFIKKLQSKDYQIALYHWVAQYNDPMNIFERFRNQNTPLNYPGWENEAYNHILKISSTLTSPTERFQFLDKAEEILTNEMPLACLYHWNVTYLQKDYIKNFYISPIGSIHLERVELDN